MQPLGRIIESAVRPGVQMHWSLCNCGLDMSFSQRTLLRFQSTILGSAQSFVIPSLEFA